MFLLKPRRIAIPDLLVLTASSSKITLLFESVSVHDHELLNFFNDCAKQDMGTINCHLRQFQGIFPVAFQLVHYELTDLRFRSVTAVFPSSINFNFEFKNLRKYTA